MVGIFNDGSVRYIEKILFFYDAGLRNSTEISFDY